MLPALMQATSRESLHGLRAQLDQSTATLEAQGAQALSGELAQVSDLLASEPGLRRALSDSSAQASSREQLATRLFGGQVSDSALELVKKATTQAWSKPGDLVDALTDLSHQAAFISAEKSGSFATVEEELFRFGRALDANGELEQTLSDASAPLAQRQQLLGALVKDANPITIGLLRSVLSNPRAASTYNSVQGLVEDAAGRRRRSVAVVTSPVVLTDEQERRLTSALSRIYGREVSVSIDVDPTILGGLRVQVGDDVIDGSIAGRLDDIQRRFAG
ncbi:MAG: F0F1 ATP synthase subunit delta [Cumulibacter sp.]